MKKRSGFHIVLVIHRTAAEVVQQQHKDVASTDDKMRPFESSYIRVSSNTRVALTVSSFTFFKHIYRYSFELHC